MDLSWTWISKWANWNRRRQGWQVKFVDVVDVTGKELLTFDRSGDSWLIDPDTVFAYKLHKSK